MCRGKYVPLSTTGYCDAPSDMVPTPNCKPEDPNYLTPLTFVGTDTGYPLTWSWQKCLRGEFVNQVCVGDNTGQWHKEKLGLVKLKWTDNTEMQIGYAEFYPTWYNLKCIDIDVAGGESVTTFQLSQSGDYVSYFYLKTSRNQEVKHDGGVGSPIISSDVGSGMICGYIGVAWDDFPWGDNGNSLGSLNSASSMPPSSLVPSLAGGDSGAVVNKFGLVFLKNISGYTIEGAEAEVTSMADVGDSSGTKFGGRFLCTKPNQTKVCSNSMQYQFGSTGTMTTTNVETWSKTFQRVRRLGMGRCRDGVGKMW